MGVEGTERRILGSEPGAGNLEGTAAMHTSDDRGARLGDEYSTGESPSHGTGSAGHRSSPTPAGRADRVVEHLDKDNANCSRYPPPTTSGDPCMEREKGLP